ncbi:MAG: DUF4139 domain-containing protein [Phycisphaerales bacterium]
MHITANRLATVAGAVLTITTSAGAAADAIAANAAPGPSLTIYNQNFAVVRESLNFTLGAGENRVRFADTTAHLEPDSVILRDPSGARRLSVLEQNYRADAVSEGLLLNLYEGKTIDFETAASLDGSKKIIKGEIVRSGYVAHTQAFSRYGGQYAQAQMARAYGPSGQAAQPLVKVDGKLMFGLPGTPIFPALVDDSILKPTLDWVLSTDKPGPVAAELGYLTGGMSWQADYIIVAPAEPAPGTSPAEEIISLVGWVTVDNQSGKSFENAKLKLMAGDVNKLQDAESDMPRAASLAMRDEMAEAPVTERSFDDLHLYTISRATTLRDRETKQVEFVKAEKVASKRLYIYDGAFIDRNQRFWDFDSIRNNREYGTKSNPKVWIMREFKNSEGNGLGVPLPKGALRFYRQDAAVHGGQLEFVGENTIDHTPKDETVRVYTGNAFDVVGERKQTDYQVDSNRRFASETFEIKLRNHKTEPVEVRVVEHLYRWSQWEVRKPSREFEKLDARTIEFRVMVKPDAEEKVTYTAQYSW